MWNYKKQIFIFVLFLFVITSTFGRRSGGRSRTSSSRSRTHGSHTTHHTGSSYPKQTYTTNTGTAHTNYGWKTHTGGSNTGHYYNSPHTGSSSTNWGSPHHSPSQNVFATFHPVGVVAPSYHFHKSTTYVPIYIPSSHTYIHRHHTNTDRTSTTVNNNAPPVAPSEPVVYKENSSSDENSKPTMIVGFNNMIVYGVFENEKHYVITISEDLDDDTDDIPDHFLRTEDSSLFEIVTMKPTTTTTTATTPSSEITVDDVIV